MANYQLNPSMYKTSNITTKKNKNSILVNLATFHYIHNHILRLAT
jgi:hypothetical protein